MKISTWSDSRPAKPGGACRIWLGAVLACFCAFGPRALQAQVAESASGGAFNAVSVYGLVSADQRQFGYGKTLGWTSGLTFAHSRHLALSTEASEVKWHAPVHDYTALAGPRFILPEGRFRLFGEGLVGLGHASYLIPNLRRRHLTQSFGTAYGVGAGLDLRLSPRLSWRVMQANYTHISVGPKGVHPLSGSTGFVFRLF